MGVPSYFSYLIRNHKDMLIKLFNFKKEINNLYFDSNSIVYDVLRMLSKDYENYKNDDKFEDELILGVCKQLDAYIDEIKPNNQVYIAEVLDTGKIDTPQEMVTALTDTDGILDAVDVNAGANSILIIGGTTQYIYGVSNDTTAAITLSEIELLATVATDLQSHNNGSQKSRSGW